MTPHEEIDKALELVAKARNRWEYEENQGPLWQAAQKYPKEMIESYYRYPDHQLSIAWCLAHVKSNAVREFFTKEARNKSQYVRSYAILNLRKYKSKKLVELFVSGLKDRSDVVKGESLKAVDGMKDDRIKNALKHLLTLKSFRSNSPGFYKKAVRLLQSYENS